MYASPEAVQIIFVRQIDEDKIYFPLLINEEKSLTVGQNIEENNLIKRQISEENSLIVRQFNGEDILTVGKIKEEKSLRLRQVPPFASLVPPFASPVPPARGASLSNCCLPNRCKNFPWASLQHPNTKNRVYRVG